MSKKEKDGTGKIIHYPGGLGGSFFGKEDFIVMYNAHNGYCVKDPTTARLMSLLVRIAKKLKIDPEPPWEEIK